MTAYATLSCDGHRHGQPCRGTLHTSRPYYDAHAAAAAAGWRSLDTVVEFADGDLCPSSGHDEDVA